MSPVTKRWLGLLPRDAVMVRDGRSFDAGNADGSGSDAVAVSPWPSTVAGAVTTAFAEAEPAEVRGPVLGQRHPSGGWTPFFPAPADLVTTEGAARRNRGRIPALRLCPARFGAGPAGAGPAWSITTDLDEGPELPMVPPAGHDAIDPVAGLLPAEVMITYLADELRAATDLRRAGLQVQSPLVPERRVGLARDNRTAKEGFLYSATYLRPADGWGFLVECVDGDDTAEVSPQGAVPLGGKARIVDVETISGCCWPQAPKTYPDGRVLLYVATPAVWPGGWRPPLPPDARLVGACVPAPLPVAAASARRARQPRRHESRPQGLLATASLRWAVPAGAMYLLQFDTTASGRDAGTRAAEWAVGIHGRALGPSADHDPGTGADRTRTAGFGVVLTGRWGGHDSTASDGGGFGRATTGKDHMR